MIASGIKSKIVCVDTSKLDSSFAGRDWNTDLLQALPPGIDACGENGEFHTFVFELLIFTRALDVHTGELVERSGFKFVDLL